MGDPPGKDAEGGREEEGRAADCDSGPIPVKGQRKEGKEGRGRNG